MNTVSPWLVAMGCCLLIGGGTSPASGIADGKQGGTFAGTVKFDGEPPAPKTRKLDDENAKGCKCEKVTLEELKVDKETRGIANAVVEILNCGEPWGGDGRTVDIDQKNCVFLPHLVVVAPGSKVELKNSDEVLHNVKSNSKLNPCFNEGIPPGSSTTKTFGMAERVRIACDVHSWMSAWVIVTRNAHHAVTDEKGAFEIGDVPPGKYKVRVWQETLGAQEKEIEIPAGGRTEASFEMKKEKK